MRSRLIGGGWVGGVSKGGADANGLPQLLVVFFLEDTAAAVAQAHVHLAALRVLEHGLTG